MPNKKNDKTTVKNNNNDNNVTENEENKSSFSHTISKDKDILSIYDPENCVDISNMWNVISPLTFDSQELNLNDEKEDNKNTFQNDEDNIIDNNNNKKKNSNRNLSNLVETLDCPDALVKSINDLLRFDLNYISKLTNLSKDEVLLELEPYLFLDPEKFDEQDKYTGYVLRDEYLSGNVVSKYFKALEAVKKYGNKFSRNVTELKKVVENTQKIEHIDVSINASWLPISILEDFVREKLYTSTLTFDPVIEEDKETHIKKLTVDKEMSSKFETHSMNATTLFNKTLSNTQIKIYVTKDDKRVYSEENTVQVLKKQEDLINTFNDWLFEDKNRLDLIEKTYLNTFCTYVPRKYFGDYLTFRGLNKKITLYPHQKDAIARIIFSPNTLLAHNVGAGKTFTMICAGMKLHQLKISLRNMYVVSNNILSQWSDMFKYCFPESNVFTIVPEEFTPATRNSILKNIVDNDYDAIIIPYSSFGMIPSKKVENIDYSTKLQNLIAQKVKEGYSKNLEEEIKKTLKEYEKEIMKSKRSRYDKNLDISFEDLHITRLFVDEAHNFKNIPINSNRQDIKGLGLTSSSLCDDMLDKVRIVQHNNNGGGVIFATATPITNSFSDIYVMQTYLQKGMLDLLKLDTFDSWTATFARVKNEYELDIDTQSYKLFTRFSNYINIDLLVNLTRNFIDYFFIDDKKNMPSNVNYETIEAEPNPDLKDFLKNISIRADNVRTNKVSKTYDNLLKITTDGRKAALDTRLVNYKSDFPSSKLNLCVNNVFRIYNETKEQKLTQLIFSDISVPKNEFNIYDDIKNKLVNLGVSKKEIEYIQEATTETKKLKLFEKVNNGEVRILLGSTIKLGQGVNVQQKLVAIHHLDVPWRPSDMVQREGRINRTGNTNSQIYIYRYVTKESFDAYSWQLLELKQKFISQLLSGTFPGKNVENVYDNYLSYGEIKALAIGNPLIKQRCVLINELNRLKLLSDSFTSEKVKYDFELSTLLSKISKQEELIKHILLDKEYVSSLPSSLNKNVDSNIRKEVREKLESVFENFDDNLVRTSKQFICSYLGFDIFLPSEASSKKMYVLLVKNSTYKCNLNDSKGHLTRIDNVIYNISKIYDEEVTKLNDYLDRKKFILEKLKEENPYKDKILELKTEIYHVEEKLDMNSLKEDDL